MNSLQRLTFISDPTDEFPNNANNSFKVRLPERLTLPGEGWHAALMSLTVPDQGQNNAVVATDPHTKVIKFKFTQVIRWHPLGSYRRVETPAVDVVIELENIMNADQIVATGSMFWKRVMQEVHNKIMYIVAQKQKQVLLTRRDERPVVSGKKKCDATTDMERRYLDHSCSSQKGFVEREPNRHGGVSHQPGYCAQVWVGGGKEK